MHCINAIYRAPVPTTLQGRQHVFQASVVLRPVQVAETPAIPPNPYQKGARPVESWSPGQIGVPPAQAAAGIASRCRRVLQVSPQYMQGQPTHAKGDEVTRALTFEQRNVRSRHTIHSGCWAHSVPSQVAVQHTRLASGRQEHAAFFNGSCHQPSPSNTPATSTAASR